VSSARWRWSPSQRSSACLAQAPRLGQHSRPAPHSLALVACDANGTVGHGCNADCTLQSGAICVEDEDQLSHCRFCGNGLREEGEVCDDGSADASPGCETCSAVTAGWSCTGGSYTVPDQCVSGPAIPSAPFATSETLASITWQWSAADGHGLPVSIYVFE
jgi:cysteine-rich repeat protein